MFRYSITLVSFVTLLAESGIAQTACPSSEKLTGEPVLVSDFFKTQEGPTLAKGEFETSAQFEARKGKIDRPSSALIELELSKDVFSYDADNQRFRVSIFSDLETRDSFRSGYGSNEIMNALGDYNYGRPVHLLGKEVLTSEEEYTASNAYGAETVVSKKSYERYVIFDNKGRKKISSGDDLFVESPELELRYLYIPVPLETAPEVKSSLKFIALVAPKAPWVGKVLSSTQPTRQFPYDIRNTYNFVFADIQCLGVANGAGELLAHWATR